MCSLSFLDGFPLAHSASWYASLASEHGRLLCSCLALFAFLTSWESSPDHQGTEKKAGIDKGTCWATASYVHLTSLSTPTLMSLMFL
jgi:hypothetical protein